jgi:hypothetical protein
VLFALCSVILLLPYGYPVLTRYVRAMDVVQVPLESKIYFSAEPLSFLVPGWGWDALWRQLPHRAAVAYGSQFPGELEHFAGFVCFGLLALVICFVAKRARGRFWLFAAALFALLALGPVLKWLGAIPVKSLPYGVIVMPGTIFHRLFITEGMRVYARFGIMVLLSLSVFVGCNVRLLGERFRLGTRAYQMAAALLCIVALAEKSSVPMSLARVEVPQVFSALRSVSPGRAILSFPFSHDSTYLFLQTIHEHPIVNSYVSRGDEETRRFYKSLYLMNLLNTSDAPVLPLDMAPDELRRRLREEREQLRIDFFIVHKHYLRGETIAAMRAFFGDFLGIRAAYEDRAVLIFGDQTITSKPQGATTSQGPGKKG